MKVLLTTLNAKYIHSSLALRYLEKYCASEETEILIEEYTINDHIEKITKNIYQKDAHVVGFSCYIWNITMTLEIADRLKKVKPDCMVILGGPEVSYDAVDLLSKHSYIDYIVVGEGEETLKELLRCLSSSQSPVGIQGLVARAADGKIVDGGSRPFISHLDVIPCPYNENDLNVLKGKIIYYETSRGCPFQCSYCLSSTIEGVRYFSMDRVKSDLLFLIRNKVKQVKFVDRTFNCHKKRAMEIFEFLAAHAENTNFHFEIAADLLDDDMIEYLSKIPKGLFQFEIGVQSTNPETIKSIDRKMAFSRVAQNVIRLRQNDNIHLHLDLIAGLPEEDYASFASSFDDVFGLRPHVLQLGFLKLLKGSKIRQQAEQYGYKCTTVPPYEVLENNRMSYGDIVKLKGIEDILEKYHNSGAFGKSVHYMLRHHYPSPFRFFEDMAVYFEDKGFDKRSCSRKSLYDILFKFYKEKISGNTEEFSDYLKYDFVLNQKGANLPYWAYQEPVKEFREKCFEFLKNENNIKEFLPQYIGIPAKKIIKEVGFAGFRFNVLKGDRQKTVLLFDYNTLKTYDITRNFL